MAPPFLEIVADPVRWGLLRELTAGDHRVTELSRAVDQPQALVSYHLGRLREAGLVSARRSSFDGRVSYYRLHPDRCADLIAGAARALHPGLTLGLQRRPGRGTASVLFVCTGNGSRSQIAEALLRHREGHRFRAASAGSHPTAVHANTVAVLAERGIDARAAASKHVDTLANEHFDVVVTLCDKVREICPEFPGQRRTAHWSVDDPSAVPGPRRASMAAFRAVADDLAMRIDYLVGLIDDDLQKEHHHG
jgi:protein-tyrosine-phosphatase